MTWWLVAIVPSRSIRKPVPPPSTVLLWKALSVTTEGETSLNSSAGVLSAGFSGLCFAAPASLTAPGAPADEAEVAGVAPPSPAGAAALLLATALLDGGAGAGSARTPARK